jgi:serine/threonine protein kinase
VPPGTGSVGSNTPGSVPVPGTRIHQYELIRQLGTGGMGAVFLARDTRLGRRVAIKFLHSADSDTTKRFILEARATARCSHENIVIIYEVGEFQGRPFMVLEYLQGQPLHKVLGGPRVPPTRAVELMVPVVRALAMAHGEGIVHRDLKPENILVTDSGTIKVLDFGIAKVLQGPERAVEQTRVSRMPSREEGVIALPLGAGEELSNLTRSGLLVGTLSYMSPEQWRGGAEVDPRTDIWAVGIILFRMLAGRHPLDPLRGPQLAVTAFLDEPMPRLRQVAPDVPAELADVVDRCLLKHKDQRFPDAQALLRALEPFLPGRYSRELRVDESPYAGLSAFQEADADRFFGRAREVASLVNRVHDRPITAVVGPSGAGKSSFVRAGLAPALKRSGEAWEVLVIRPGRQPLAALANLIAPLIGSSTSLVDTLAEYRQIVERMRVEPGLIGSILRGRARQKRKRLLLFVDQFEELYTQVPDAAERKAFTACLSAIADDVTVPIRLVLSVRSDFLDRISEDERFMTDVSQGLFLLAPPSREGLRDALVQPAEMAGYRFETPEMVEQILQHLDATQGALPLLQFAASLLWEQRDPARRLITTQSYEAIGGITGALARHADNTLSGLSPQARAIVRSIFLHLVTPERTRAIASMEELRELSRDTAEIERLADHLVQARLLVVQMEGSAGGATVELVHESLIHGWPTLKRWLEESQEDAAFLEQLRGAARQWQARGHDSGLLWRGEMVEEARRFQRRYGGQLPQVQVDFLGAVFAQRARAAWRKRAALVGSAIFLVLLVAASAVALVVIRKAEQRALQQAELARRAEVQERAAKAEAQHRLAEVQAEVKARQEAQGRLEQTRMELEASYKQMSEALSEKSEALIAKMEEKKKASLSARSYRQARDDLQQALSELMKRWEADKKAFEEFKRRNGPFPKDLE